MKTRQVTLPLIGLVAGTRVLIGVGLGLLLAGLLPPQRRRAIGWTLLTVGGLSTVPLAAAILSRRPSRGEDALIVERNPISPYVSEEEEHAINAPA